MNCTLCGAALFENQPYCGACGSFSGHRDNPLLLPSGTSLHDGVYTVDRLLGQGGFGITYQGSDERLRRTVAIKEFFPERCARQGSRVMTIGRWNEEDYREARQRFLDEARMLARFEHPAIVRVHNAFEENNTAYMVMELLRGKTLLERVKTEGPLKEHEARRAMDPVVDALELLHQSGLLHRDIKPENIILTDSGRAVLIDFGTAREFARGATQSYSLTLTPGYAPLEQYARRARRGPYSDIYSLAATFYHLVTGEEPPAATDRAAGVDLIPPRIRNPRIGRSFSDAVLWGMSMRVEDRPQTIREFMDAVRGEIDSPVDAESIRSLPWRDSPPVPTPAPAPNKAPLPAPNQVASTPGQDSAVNQGMGCELILAGCAVAVMAFAILVFVLVTALSR